MEQMGGAEAVEEARMGAGSPSSKICTGACSGMRAGARHLAAPLDEHQD